MKNKPTMSIEDSSHLCDPVLQVRARAGSHITSCLREAIAYAMLSQMNVVLTHNDIDYDIDYEKIVDSIDTKPKPDSYPTQEDQR